MATIVTRSGKGSALTHTEADANFTNLNTDKMEGISSSTDNAIVRWSGTGGATLQNSSTTISDAGDIVVGGTTPTITIGDGGAEDAALIFDGNAQDFYIGLDDSADDLVIGLGSTLGTTPAMSIDENQVVTFHQDPIFGGTTPTITLGDGGAEDTALIYDGNALDFHIGLDDTADDLVIGTGSTLGTNTLISINGDASEVKFNVPKITIGDATAEDTYLNFDGNAQDYRIGIDDGTDILEIGLGTAHGTTIALKIDSSANVTIPTKLIMSDVTSGKFLVGDGTSYEEVALSGDATLASGGALTVAAGAIENSMLANMAANTVKVRNANSSGAPSDVALATTEILIGDGTGFTAAALSGDVSMTNSGAVTIASAAVETAMVNANVVTGQTAETSIANDDIVLIYDTSATALRKMTKANFISGTGTGDASGPGSSTDNAIARFDGTGGKTLQNSGSTIDDSGNLTAVAGTFTGAFTSLGIDDNADAVAITIDSAEKVGIGVTSPKTKVTIEGALTLKEQSAADGDTAAYGQLWVKSDTPNTLYFTDDAGTDTELGGGGTTINNNADNRVITGSGTADTLEGEANLTYDGADFKVNTTDFFVDGSGDGVAINGSAMGAASKLIVNGAISTGYGAGTDNGIPGLSYGHFYGAYKSSWTTDGSARIVIKTWSEQALCVVSGNKPGDLVRFADVILMNATHVAPVLVATTQYGSNPTRTYSNSSTTTKMVFDDSSAAWNILVTGMGGTQFANGTTFDDMGDT